MRLRFCAAILPGLLSAFSSAGANDTVDRMAVDLELVLAVDVSGSMDRQEAKLQRQGYVSAFRHPSIADAIENGPQGRIAVVYFEWGGYGNTHLVLDWTVIKDRQSAVGFADQLERTARLVAQRTSISGAIHTGIKLLRGNRYVGKRRVIDISGDGANNSGDLVTWARDRAVAKGITINGLPILNDRLSRFGHRQIANLDLYYRDCVIGGPGAFHIVANNFDDFARAVLRKLALEIAGLHPTYSAQIVRVRGGRWPVFPGRAELTQIADARRTPPCYIGEQIWHKRRTGEDDGWMPQFPYR